MIADIRQVLDYIHCPMLYRFRNVDRIQPTTIADSRYRKENEQGLEELFDSEVHKIGYHIFNYIQDGTFPSQKVLRSKWSRLWLRNKNKTDILFEVSTERSTTTQRRLERLGVRVIDQMWTKFRETPGIPILVGQQTEVAIGKHRITIKLDLVREIKIEDQAIIEIMDFKTGLASRINESITTPLNLHIHNDLEVTAASYAFRQLTGAEEDRITYYDMVRDKEYVTVRTEKDYKALEKVLDHVEVAIANEIYYPVMNAKCLECPFQKLCAKRDWYK